MESTKVSAGLKIAPLRFVRESVLELRKVSWPTRAETIKLTVVVIVISLIVGLFIGGVDILFVQLSTLLYSK